MGSAHPWKPKFDFVCNIFFTWLIIVSGNVLCLKNYKNNSIPHFKSIRSVLFRVYLGQESHFCLPPISLDSDMLETWNLIEWCAPGELLKKYTNEKIYQLWFPGSHSLAEVSIFCTQIENLYIFFKEPWILLETRFFNFIFRFW